MSVLSHLRTLSYQVGGKLLSIFLALCVGFWVDQGFFGDSGVLLSISWLPFGDLCRFGHRVLDARTWGFLRLNLSFPLCLHHFESFAADLCHFCLAG